MRPKEVEINNQSVADPVLCEVTLEGRSSPGNLPGGVRSAARIEIGRDATPSASAAWFGLATNGDGTVKFFSGKVVLQDAQRQSTYTVDFQKAYVQSWSIHAVEGAGSPTERIVVRSGHVSLTAGGTPATLDLPEFALRAGL